MLVFNQQANIKNVNGAIADVFANRPAPQSTFYIFYSTDTQEIFYDNGAWILIGSGGGGVNIYNSDGTLNAWRYIDINNNNVFWNNANTYVITNTGGSNQFMLDNAGISFFYNLIGIHSANYSTGLNITLGSLYGANFRGLITQNIFGVDTNGVFNGAPIWNGLQLDLQNRTYIFGQITSGNQIHFNVDDNIQVLSTYKGNNRLGLEFDYTINEFKIGDVNGNFNNNQIKVNDQANYIELGKPGKTLLQIDNDTSDTLKTVYNGNDIGLKLDFANGLYFLGDYSNASNVSYNANGTFFVQYNGLSVIDANAQTFDIAIGDTNGAANNTLFSVSDINEIIKTQYNTNDIGLKLDFANSTYQFGQITGGNTTFLTINDAATYPVQIDGTNVLSGTSGSTSGQHLKIKINGVDYKIELKNP